MIDDRLRDLVRDAVAPMLTDLEDRLAARLAPPRPEPRPELLTSKEVARLLRVDPRTVERMSAAGDLPGAVRVSPRRVLWRRAAIDTWLDQGGLA